MTKFALYLALRCRSRQLEPWVADTIVLTCTCRRGYAVRASCCSLMATIVLIIFKGLRNYLRLCRWLSLVARLGGSFLLRSIVLVAEFFVLLVPTFLMQALSERVFLTSERS